MNLVEVGVEVVSGTSLYLLLRSGQYKIPKPEINKFTMLVIINIRRYISSDLVTCFAIVGWRSKPFYQNCMNVDMDVTSDSACL